MNTNFKGWTPAQFREVQQDQRRAAKMEIIKLEELTEQCCDGSDVISFLFRRKEKLLRRIESIDTILKQEDI